MKKRSTIVMGGLAVGLLLSQTVLTAEAKSMPKHSTPVSKHSTPVSKHSTPVSKHSTPVSKHTTPVSKHTQPTQVKTMGVSKSGVVTKPHSTTSKQNSGKEQVGKNNSVPAKVNNLELEIQTSKGKPIKVQYKVDKKGVSVQIKEATGTITKDMVTKLVADIQNTSTLSKTDLLAKIQADLSLPANAKVHANVRFLNGKDVEGDGKTTSSSHQNQTSGSQTTDPTDTTSNNDTTEPTTTTVQS